MKLTVRALQLFIGLLLLATATGKLMDLGGFAQVLATYALLPRGGLLPTAVGLASFELGLSLWVLSGIGLSFAALAALLLHLLFAAVAVASNLRGLDIPNCGCFGVFWARPMTWGTVVEDLFLMAACAVLYLLARRANGRWAR